MMRDIKFRGLCDGEWVYGYYIVQPMFNGSLGHYIFDGEYEHKVDPETVGQYVNYYSVDFFDGDLMAITCDCDSEYGCTHGEVIYKIEWNKSSSGYILSDTVNDRQYSLDEFGEENMRIVGNIYDK